MSGQKIIDIKGNLLFAKDYNTNGTSGSARVLINEDGSLNIFNTQPATNATTGALVIPSGGLAVAQSIIAGGTISVPTISAGNIQISGTISASNIAVPSLNATSIDVATATIGSLTGSTIQLSGAITAAGISVPTIAATNALYTNLSTTNLLSSNTSLTNLYVSTVLNASGIQIDAGSLSTGSIGVSGTVSASTLRATTVNLSDLVTTSNVSTARITAGRLVGNFMQIADITASNNILANTFSGTSLQVSGTVSANTLAVSLATASNLQVVNISAATGRFSGGISAENSRMTNVTMAQLDVTGAARIANETVTNSLATNISVSTLRANSGIINTSLNALGNSNTLGSVITTGGNVGIGVVAPAHRLDVDGTVDATVYTGGSIEIAGSITTGGLFVRNNVSIAGDLTILGATTQVSTENLVVLDNIIVVNSAPDGTSDAGLMVNLTGGSANASAIYFKEGTDEWTFAYTNTSATAENLTIDSYAPVHAGAGFFESTVSAANVQLSGSITAAGISVPTIAADNLNITRITVGTLSITTSFTSPNGLITNSQVTNETVQNVRIDSSLNASSVTANLGGVNSGLRNTLGNFLFTDSTGVGIGTTQPSSALQVVGTITATTYTGSNQQLSGSVTSSGLHVNNNIQSNTLYIGQNIDSGYTLNRTVHVIDPDAVLAVHRYTTSASLAGGIELVWGQSSGNKVWDMYNDVRYGFAIRDRTNSNLTRFGINGTTGHVGIGVDQSFITGPSHTLTVYGTTSSFGYTGGSMQLSGAITAAGISVPTIAATNAVYTNLSSTNLNVASVTTTNLVGTNISSTNLDVTDIDTGVLKATTGITSASALVTNLTATNETVTNLRVITSLNASGIQVDAGSLSAGSVQVSGTVSASTLAVSLVTASNLHVQNITSATGRFSGGITAENSRMTNVTMAQLDVTGAARIANQTVTNSLVTNISTSTLRADTATVNTTLNALGNSNTLGSIITTGGNVGIAVAAPAHRLDVDGTIDATVYTGGSLQIGGSGTFGSLAVTNSVIIGGNLTVSGSVTNVSTENLVILDNIIVVNSAPDGTSDAGIVANLTGGSASATGVFFKESTDRWTFAYTNTGATADNLTIESYTPVHAGAAFFEGSISGASLQVSGTITAGGISIPTIAADNLNVTRITVANLTVNTNVTAASVSALNSVTTNLTSSNVNATDISTATLNATTVSATNLRSTRLTTGTLVGTAAVHTIGNIFISGGNIGIGDSDPTVPITFPDINGSKIVLSFADGGYSGLSKSAFQFNSIVPGGNSFVWYVGGTNSDGTVLMSLNTNQLSIFEPVRAVDNSNTLGSLFTTGGNVGIGTTSPTQRLSVVGNVSATVFTGESLAITGTVSAGNLRASFANVTDVVVTNLTGTSLISTNINATNLTTSTLVSNSIQSTSFSGTSLQLSGTITAAGISVPTISATDAVYTNVSINNLNVGSSMTSVSAQITNLNGSSITTATLNVLTSLSAAAGVITQLNATNVSAATGRFSGGITAENSLMTNVTTAQLDVTGAARISNETVTNSFVTNISTSTLRASTATVTTSLNALGNTNTLGSLITTGGNVGINTTSPLHRLDVNGTVRATTYTGGALQISGAVSAAGLAVTGNVAVGGNLTVVGAVTNVSTENLVVLDNLLVINSAPDGVSDAGLLASLTGGSASATGVFFKESTDRWTFAYTDTSATADTVVISSYTPVHAGAAFFEGVVSAANMQLSGSITAAGISVPTLNSSNLSATSSTFTNSLITNLTASSARLTDSILSSATAVNLRVTTGLNASGVTAQFGSVNSGTNNTLGGFLFTNTTGVGINTTNPTSVLTVNGTASATVLTGGNVYVGSSFYSQYSYIGANVGSVVNTRAFEVVDPDAAGLFWRYTTSTALGTAFELVWGTGASKTATGNMYWDVFIQPGLGFGFRERTNNVNLTRMAIQESTGNVGIGIGSPSFLLHVNGTARATTYTGGSVEVLGGTISNLNVSTTITGPSLQMTNGTFGSLRVNNTLNVSSVSLVVTGDIGETTFAAANNVSSPANVTGLSFSSAVRGARIYATVSIDATTNLYAIFILEVVQRDSDWVISGTSTGDNTGINFTITTGGQVQYTSTNLSGFVSNTIKFRAYALSA